MQHESATFDYLAQTTLTLNTLQDKLVFRTNLTLLFLECSTLRLPTQYESNCGWYSCTCEQLAMAGDGDKRVWKSFLWRFTSGSLLGDDSSSLYDWTYSIWYQDKVVQL